MGERMATGLPSSCFALRAGSKRATTSSTRLPLRHPGESREPEELQHRPTRWGRKRKSYNAALPGESRRRSDNAVNPIKADQSSYNVVMPTMKLHHRHPSSPVLNPFPYVNTSPTSSSRRKPGSTSPTKTSKACIPNTPGLSWRRSCSRCSRHWLFHATLQSKAMREGMNQ